MNKRKVSILVCFIGLLVIAFVAILVSVYFESQAEKYENTVKVIEKAAQACILDKVCEQKDVTLKELYKTKYLEKVINPVTKKYFNDNSYVNYPSYKFVLYE